MGHALSVMDEYDLEWAELQFIADKEVGDLDKAGAGRRCWKLIKLAPTKGCLYFPPWSFCPGLPMASTRPGDAVHSQHMDALKRCIEMAHEFSCGTVRIMSGRKEMILFGLHGAEKWNVAKGAWDALPPLIAPAVELARAEERAASG